MELWQKLKWIQEQENSNYNLSESCFKDLGEIGMLIENTYDDVQYCLNKNNNNKVD